MELTPQEQARLIKLDPRLLSYCDTDRQREVLAAYIEHGTSEAAAKHLNCRDSNVRHIVNTIQRNAAKKGWNPIDRIPEGYKLKGRSTLRDADGNTKIEWIKTEVDKERMEQIMRETTEALAEPIKPWPVVKAPKKTASELCTVYTITDYHIGAYSWKEESGEDWDLKIAEETLYKAFTDMIDASPDAEQAVFCQMGDFLHWDGLSAITPLNKHVLDSDGRYGKLVQIAILTCIRAVEMLLHKHKRVHVVICEGNHDLTGSVWLQAIMRNAFEKNKRVTIDDSVFPYYSFSWGKVFLGWHHGHLTKIKGLAGKFFSEPRFRKDMSGAEYIYLSTGHFHTKESFEDSGAYVERHPTLNARDAYGARGFQHSQRGALAITYDKEKGETTRITVTP